MSKSEKIAVIRDGMDVARIIPFNPKDGTYDFKIDLLKNDYDINIYQLFNPKPLVGTVYAPQDWEITYHKRKEDKPPSIHLKHKPVENPKTFFDAEHPEYITLPIQHLQEPNINCEFPVPLMKIEIPNSALSKSYKKKKRHRLLDLGKQNVLELFLTDARFKFSHFERRWPCVSGLYMIYPLESFASNSIHSHPQKLDNFLPHGGEQRLAGIAHLMNNFLKISSNIYFDKRVDETKKKITLTFIENELSTAIAVNTLIAYPLVNKSATEYDAMYVRCAYENELRSVEVLFAPVPPMIWKPNILHPRADLSPCVSAFERDVLINKYSEIERLKLREILLDYRKELLNAMKENVINKKP